MATSPAFPGLRIGRMDQVERVPIILKKSVRTQNWHKADQADATGLTGVPQRSDRWSVL
jgi:hypothetical protein